MWCGRVWCLLQETLPASRPQGRTTWRRRKAFQVSQSVLLHKCRWFVPPLPQPRSQVASPMYLKCYKWECFFLCMCVTRWIWEWELSVGSTEKLVGEYLGWKRSYSGSCMRWEPVRKAWGKRPSLSILNLTPRSIPAFQCCTLKSVQGLSNKTTRVAFTIGRH